MLGRHLHSQLSVGDEVFLLGLFVRRVSERTVLGVAFDECLVLAVA